MRIKRLDLKAFGPFTGQSIEFASQQPGLHIIFGANEAGKSSSLRALKALLYGFDERTADNFLHANDKLLVAGCLEGSGGQELLVQRRKKRKADLLDADGAPLAPGVLAPFLHGIEQAVFESLYGIDHKTLIAGGKDILAEKGEIGKALFAAGTGISSLKSILDDLESEANELFRERGSTQQINRAIREYGDLKKIVKEASLPPGRWQEHRQRFQEAEARQAELETERKIKSAEIQRLERLAKCLPELADLENLQAQLAEMGKVVVLAPGFPEQVRDVAQQIRETGLHRASNEERLQKLREKLGGISPNRAILRHAAAIDDLHQRLGAYRKGKLDRGKLDGMRIAHRQDAGALLEAIRPDLTLKDADSLRPVLNRKRTIHELTSRYEALHQQTRQASQAEAEAREKLNHIGQALATLPPPGEAAGLAKAINLAQRTGDIDGEIEALSREIVSSSKRCQAELQRLGLWAGDPEQLPGLPLPLPETVRRFEQAFADLANEKQQRQRDRHQAAADLHEAQAASKELVYTGEVPAEGDLLATRRKRQEGWQLLRRRWLDGEDITRPAQEFAPGQTLPDAYELLVRQADDLADRLRREADRVTRAAALRVQTESIEETIRALGREEEEIAAREQGLIAVWQAEWEAARIQPLTPREMLAWLTDIDRLRLLISETGNKRPEETARSSLRRKVREALVEELHTLGEETFFPDHALAPVLVVAESVLAAHVRKRDEWARLEDKQTMAQQELLRARKTREEAAAAMIDWQGQWRAALAALGLQVQVLPGEALDLLDTIANCFDKLDKVKDFQSRMDGIDRDGDEFCAEVAALLGEASPDLHGLPPEQAVPLLHAMLDQARRDDDQFRATQTEIDAVSEQIPHAQLTLHSLQARMAELLATAQCSREADLGAAIGRSTQYQQLQTKIAETRSRLAKLREGVSLEEIRRQAGAVNPDELAGRIVTIRMQITDDLEPRIKEALKLMGEEGKELQLMDASGRAAEAAENMEQVAARIHHLVARYTKIKLAGMVLRDEIERYREEHQDPILRIASRIFSELTLGSFSGLRADIDDSGNPVLIGVRPDAARVAVSGMSDGTCDQLYLALRLATLEWRLEKSEPMPFIVDDILINFDDARSKATLQALAHLSRRNQVILFTHHRQIVREAATLQAVYPVVIHELRNVPAP